MKSLTRVILLVLLAGLLTQGQGQVVNEKSKRNFSIGVGLYTDIMMKFPSNVSPRTINQGATVFATYNIPFGKSNFDFSLGLGISTHNIYGNFLVSRPNDTTTLIKIPSDVSYKKSKIGLAYLELPVEFRFKSKSKIAVGVGFKAGFLIGSYTKFVGSGDIPLMTGDTLHSPEKVRMKFLGVKDLSTFTYGPTFRIGYKWIHLYASYMLSSVFNKSTAPEVVPLSVGFLLMPF
jgi:hypothetical protein